VVASSLSIHGRRCKGARGGGKIKRQETKGDKAMGVYCLAVLGRKREAQKAARRSRDHGGHACSKQRRRGGAG
jgi:hypothetical protein